MTLGEIDAAFSGHASYRQHVGRRNGRRLRRFQRERGADIALIRQRPPFLRWTRWMKRGMRQKVRSLDRP